MPSHIFKIKRFFVTEDVDIMGRRRITRYNDTIGPDFSSGMIVLTIFMAAVIILCVYFICNRDPDPYKADTDSENVSDVGDETGGNGDVNSGGDSEIPESGEFGDTGEPTPEYTVVTVKSETQSAGYLILVNNDTEYDFDFEEEIVFLYGNEEKSKSYGLATVNISCAHSILPHLNDFLNAYYDATEDGKVVINSGHRTYADQKVILDDRIASKGEAEAYAYVALPGFSEHHTGYALDIASYGENNDPNWMPDNCFRYGFIQRYPSGKEDITGINYEYWHYRYVGEPHAEIMTSAGMVMEEYIEEISERTFEDPLYYTTSDGENYMIYTVPASEEEETEIKLPVGISVGSSEAGGANGADSECDYDISGNNVGGFIVTVSLGQSTEQ